MKHHSIYFMLVLLIELYMLWFGRERTKNATVSSLALKAQMCVPPFAWASAVLDVTSSP